jgi:hypothetical protein
LFGEEKTRLVVVVVVGVVLVGVVLVDDLKVFSGRRFLAVDDVFEPFFKIFNKALA